MSDAQETTECNLSLYVSVYPPFESRGAGDGQCCVSDKPIYACPLAGTWPCRP